MLGSVKRFFYLKKHGNVSWRRVFAAILRRIRHIPQFIWYFAPFGFPLRNRKNIAKYKDIHKGKRCFIIANGPSLKKINFDLLKDEITIGMNRIYLMEKENGFKPKYLACIDVECHLDPFREEYDAIDIPCFYDWTVRNNYSRKNNHVFILNKYTPNFQENLKKGYGNGTSVLYLAIQWAYYMGCNEVYIIGKDHSYNTNANAATILKSNGHEDNHFVKGYYTQGMVWKAPDYASEEQTYEIAKEYFEKNKRVIKDATIGGKLQVFEKVNFYSLFEKA